MPKLPQIKPRDVERVLLKLRFSARTTKSAHVVFTHQDGRRTVISGHNEPVRRGTLRAILRQIDITLEEFLGLLRK